MDEVLPGVVRLREQREALTKHTILRAARELFAERGYANTPVRLLAQRAGVALQTVYATYGSKAGVLAGMPDLLDHEAGVVDLFASRDSIDDPVELVGLLAKIARQIRERGGDIIKIMKSGAAVGGAEILAEGHRRRRLGVLSILERVETLGALGLPHDRAADIAVALMTDEVCDVLVDQGGWSYQEYEDWLKATLAKQLL
ncbi:TetR/AcrR family transcriptional regulator [Kibdelosporangium aridum]|uniref:TetR/AcrR family transcriptional regulator n=1 Tax=Kibdelosporangium aridum TaxID=2030 RepID=A0A428ZG47_KIBAR|nr:TetR/AcrR family transcriptional regulator [Kibdelosporangium aridum]RSM87036.1 TetR/AcrR family transcriptional regulator [Kibdelosporangium aridum]